MVVLLIVTWIVIWTTCSLSQSGRLHAHCELAVQLVTPAVSTYVWTLSTMQKLPQRLRGIHFASRNSSRQQIGDELGKAYASLSQAIAVGNSLHKIPRLVSHKRANVMTMGYRLPQGSRTTEYLLLFLEHTFSIDGDLLELILILGRIGGKFIGQQLKTTGRIDQIRKNAIGESRLLVLITGVSSSEADLRTRLIEHISLLADLITEADTLSRKSLQACVALNSTTASILQSSIDDQHRVFQTSWLVRIGALIFRFRETQEMVDASTNVELAQDMHQWSRGILGELERIMMHVTHAKSHTEN